MTKKNILDIHSLKQLLGNDTEICKEILIEFVKTTEDTWNIVKDALSLGDYTLAKFQLHKILGSCSSIFAEESKVNIHRAGQLILTGSYTKETFILVIDSIESSLNNLKGEIEYFCKY